MTSYSVFDVIHRDHYWGGSESTSGPSSGKKATHDLRIALERLFVQLNITAVFDGSCGDFTWQNELLQTMPYLEFDARDISSVAITACRDKYPAIPFSVDNLETCTFPDSDIWICRDTFIHLPYTLIVAILKNFANSSIPYALISSDFGPEANNTPDITVGEFRRVNLQHRPFNLPEPYSLIIDSGSKNRQLSLYTRTQIQQAVKNI